MEEERAVVAGDQWSLPAGLVACEAEFEGCWDAAVCIELDEALGLNATTIFHYFDPFGAGEGKLLLHLDGKFKLLGI